MTVRSHLRAMAIIAVALAPAGWLTSRTGSDRAVAADAAQPDIAPTVVCNAPDAGDQDDLCIWVHPEDAAKSTVITSDKAAGKLFVYDLAGKVIQTVATPRPGNIDLRYGFALGGRKVDIVAFNQRTSNDKIRVFAVDPASRKLRPIDGGGLDSGPNYGGTLFRSPKTRKVYWLNTHSGVDQYELADDGAGKLTARKVRSWQLGLCEGAVGDDETGKVYVAEESKGVWEVGGEPDDPAPGRLVARTREHGLTGDVEGLAIYRTPGGKGYLLVSSQGSNCFKVYRRDGAHEYVGTFTIRGAMDTDGIDVSPVALGAAFPQGFFGCHSNTAIHGSCPILLTPWQKIAEAFQPPLEVKTAGRRE